MPLLICKSITKSNIPLMHSGYDMGFANAKLHRNKQKYNYKMVTVSQLKLLNHIYSLNRGSY